MSCQACGPRRANDTRPVHVQRLGMCVRCNRELTINSLRAAITNAEQNPNPFLRPSYLDNLRALLALEEAS